MEQGHPNHKKLIALLIILFLIVIIGALIAWLYPSSTIPDETVVPTQFSPFERPVDRVVDVSVPEVPYTYTPPTPIDPEPQEPQIIDDTYTADTGFYGQNIEYRGSFSLPQRDTAPAYETPTYVQQGDIGYIYTPSSPEPRPIYAPASSARSTSTPPAPQEDGFSFYELDKEIFGYVSGLGWTQLLGDTGQDIFDNIYGLTPGGATNSTIGPFLPGSGSEDGGGFGGLGAGGFGGGGGSMQFGGRVNRVTECTCSSATMLDIEDVGGQTISLVYQPGASRLYEYYNVNGSGQNVLGTYTSGGACLVYVGEGCESEGQPSGTIQIIGTSES